MRFNIKILFVFILIFLISPQTKAETGLTDQGIKTLLNRAVENGKVAEYLIPDATYNNLFVKATDDEVLVGYIKTEENVDKNVDKLVVLADKKGTHALTNKLNEANESNIKNLADEVLELKGVGNADNLVWVKDIVNKRVIKTITNYDSKLGQLVEYPKYNNVALGKGSGGALEQFGKEVGANVWTKETENIFTKMYDLPDSWSFERSITSVLNETVSTNQGKILFDIAGVDIQKAVTGGLVHTPELVLKGNVTELELQMILRNKSWYDNVIFHESGKVLNNQEIVSKGLKYLGQ